MPDDEKPTSPELRRVRCPECAGSGKRLETVECGTRYVGKTVPCTLCEGDGVVDRGTFSAWHATRMGRPPR